MGWNNIGGQAQKVGCFKINISSWNVYFIYFVSAILFLMSSPVMGFYLAGLIAFVPFFAYLGYSRNRYKDGFVFGCLLGCCSFYFILTMDEGNILMKAGVFAFIVFLCGFEFLLLGFLFQISEKNLFKKAFTDIMIAIAAGCFEFILDSIYMGFHISIGYTQFNNLWIASLVKYIGQYGVSILVVYINILVSRVILLFLKKRPTSIAMGMLPNLMILVSILLVLAISHQMLTSNNIQKSTIKASIIQPNIQKREYAMLPDNQLYAENIFKRLMDLSEDCVSKKKPEVIIWPEGSVNISLMRLQKYRNTLSEFCIKNKVTMLIGCHDLDENLKEYNSVFVMSPDGTITDRYDKNICLPLTEDFFTPGISEKPLNVKGVKFGTRLCYEVLFPQLSVNSVENRADVLIFLSNNADFGYTSEPFDVIAASVFRALENNRPVIQGMNNGISGLILPDGTVSCRSHLLNKEILPVEIPVFQKTQTFYQLFGRMVYFILTVLLVAYIIISMFLLHYRRR